MHRKSRFSIHKLNQMYKNIYFLYKKNMINHYLTLRKISESLNFRLAGCKLIECFTQIKGEIVFSFINGNDDVINLAACLGSVNYTLFISNRLNRARSNTADLFPEILGETLQSVEIAENNRAILLHFINHSAAIELFGGSRNSVLILDSGNVIISSTKNAAERRGETYTIPSGTAKNPTESGAFATAGALLSRSSLLIPKPIAEEFLAHRGLNSATSIEEIPDLNDFIAEAYILRHDMESARKFYLYRDGESALLSLLPLESEGGSAEVYDDINIAAAARYAFEKRMSSLDDNRSMLLKKLIDLKTKADRNIEACRRVAEMSGKIDEYRHFAELLLSCADQKSVPGARIELEDWDGKSLEIKLDTKSSISENAALYYAKSKKIKADIEAKSRLLPKFLEKSKSLEDMITKAKSMSNIKDLNKFSKEIGGSGNPQMKQLSTAEETKYRQFDLGGGYMLYVGKNSANNDDLTVNFARPNDFWFHARGCPGSHAVLRSPNSKETRPPKDILRIAAGISAYYSKQKNAHTVAVSWTQKKYVYKPRGAAAGEVMMKREDVVMAEPKLPEGAEEGI